MSISRDLFLFMIYANTIQMSHMHTFMMGTGKTFLSRTSISGFVRLFYQVGYLKFSDLYKAHALSRISSRSPEVL